MDHRKLRFWPLAYSLLLTAFTAYLLLDTFVIPRSYSVVQKEETSSVTGTSSASAASVTDDSYVDDDISIHITQSRVGDTTVYTADIVLARAELLQTAFANDVFGKNITQVTSAIASAHHAILAINGDFYSARSGYVLRNGVLYRASSSDSQQEDLVVEKDGSFRIIREGDVSAQELLDGGATQVFSFGPALVENGKISVGVNTEVDQARTSNPRTAIGCIAPLHYVMVVSDGRTTASTGLSLYELAGYLQQLGVQTAYNLDGGGSATMVFNGTVLNQPTSDGKKIVQRKVSDIVYIG